MTHTDEEWVEIRFGTFTIRARPRQTAAAFEAVQEGAAEFCDCPGCRNFLKVRRDAFPEPVLALLRDLGVDPTKESEIARVARVGDRHWYSWWTHAIATVEADDGADAPEGQNRWFVDVAPDGVDDQRQFALGVHRRTALVPEPIRDAGESVIQIEFSARLPWRLSPDIEPD